MKCSKFKHSRLLVLSPLVLDEHVGEHGDHWAHSDHTEIVRVSEIKDEVSFGLTWTVHCVAFHVECCHCASALLRVSVLSGSRFTVPLPVHCPALAGSSARWPRFVDKIFVRRGLMLLVCYFIELHLQFEFRKRKLSTQTIYTHETLYLNFASTVHTCLNTCDTYA